MLNQGSVALQNWWTMQPKAVHARRNYDKITKEVARMIEDGRVQPDQIRFMCSEFFVCVRNGEELLVRFGERRHPYRIGRGEWRVSYADGTVIFEGYSRIKLKSVGVFVYYLSLYSALC